MDGPVGAHGRVLRCILGFECVAKNEIRRPEGAFLVNAYEFSESARVASLRGGDECLLVGNRLSPLRL